jgi:glycosyltransferase involved in cell wall biosynthesis
VRVAVIQPWLPQYRREFYERVHAKALSRGIDVDIYYGAAPPEWRAREDTITLENATELPTRFIRIGRKHFIWKSTKALRQGKSHDLYIVEQAVRNLETYGLLRHQRVTPVAFWGHGRTYTIEVGPLQERLKGWVTSKGAWFFGYTKGGVDAVVARGFPIERTTVLQNTIDASGLKVAVEGVEPDVRKAFIANHGLTDKTAIYIGGLDEMKRIPFLLEAAEIAHSIDPDFRLLVAGSGSSRQLVEAAAAASAFVVYIGPVFGVEKALALSVAQVMANPGRVGLAAVDSFAAGTPIVTTDWPWHAPEFEYLVDDQNAVITADTVSDYAQGLVGLLNAHSRAQRLIDNCRADAPRYSLDVMVDRFVSGIELALAHTKGTQPDAP